ncbi:ADP-ribosyltransferase [Bacillus thuringiensis]|uniref:ADP-ribosyltransferase n=1 Tax=Bacillus thuringiensis TaxID=1428 RepID=UPI0011AA3B3A|nr:ADP-ribosyltransferase [Bacillus thuringiensis]
MVLKQWSKKFVIVSTLAFTGGFIMPQAYAAPIDFKKDSSAATQWANMHYGNWRSSLSSNELQSIDYFTRGGFLAINKAIDQDMHNHVGLTSVMKQNINSICSALEKKPIPEDIIVYGTVPGVSGITDFSWIPRSEDYRKKTIGVYAGEDGFMRTYLQRDKAPAGSMVLYLTVPKGTKGAVVGVGSHYEDEKELILDKGYYYKITNIDKEPGTDKWIIHATISGQAK